MSDLIARLKGPDPNDCPACRTDATVAIACGRGECVALRKLRAEAAAALAAKDAEMREHQKALAAERADVAAALAEARDKLDAQDAEIERLGQSLGRMTADMMGMRDGALVRDQAAEIATLRARLTASETDHQASLDELFGSLEKATGALTAIQSALGCGPHLDDALAAIAALRARLAAAETVVEAARRAKAEDECHPPRGMIGPWVHLSGALAAHDAAKGASDAT